MYPILRVATTITTSSNARHYRLITQARYGLSKTMATLGQLRIGDISTPVIEAKTPERVPTNTGRINLNNQEVLNHIRWMLQKDMLGQDMFLVGPPGPFRRQLVMTYLNLTQRELEYIAIHRDTSADADLKQRREIGGDGRKIIWNDSCAVRAAINGRVLLIDGIEKAERNVLPVLNNLLENREMNLEDGRQLLSPTRYDQLATLHSSSNLDAWQLTRVNERFRVIALGVATPPYPGHPLDPPFRSRFQFRYVNEPLMLDSTRSNTHTYPAWPSTARDIISTVQQASELSKEIDMDTRLPVFPQGSLNKLQHLPSKLSSSNDLLSSVYPYYRIDQGLDDRQRKLYDVLLKQFNISKNTKNENAITKLALKDTDISSIAQVQLTYKEGDTMEWNVQRGKHSLLNDQSINSKLSETPRIRKVLADLYAAHAVSDICLIGPKGSGKSWVVHRFAEQLGYAPNYICTIQLYRDMPARDLLQRRVTDAKGNTTWQNSSLVEAALSGQLLVLDGAEQVHADMLATLQRLHHDREITLPNGQFLTANYDEIKAVSRLNDQEMNDKGIFKIHPSFRIVTIASADLKEIDSKTRSQWKTTHNSSGNGNRSTSWLTSEVASMYTVVYIPWPDTQEEKQIVKAATGISDDRLEPLMDLVGRLRQMSIDTAGQSSALFLSTRQIIRVVNQQMALGESTLIPAIKRALHTDLLPKLLHTTVDEILNDDIELSSWQNDKIQMKMKHANTMNTTASLTKEDAALIPTAGKFFNNSDQLYILNAMRNDLISGEYILLIGNQGVGKNKLTDRMLELAQVPRQYIQLHRDTTVSSLLVQTSIRDGVITYHDSPLIQAMQRGHVAVIDEADKAPTHVIAILKSIAEKADLLLPDGRRLCWPLDKHIHNESEETIPSNGVAVHPNFRMILLANRPGFPFHGNEFFSVIGDVLSCHVISNPNIDSELELLEQIAPNVPETTRKSLAFVFRDLRNAYNDSRLLYPYSLRELLHVVKHIERYPNESIGHVLKNIFDVDIHRHDASQIIKEILNRHKISADFIGLDSLTTAQSVNQTKLSITYEPTKPKEMSTPKHGKIDESNAPHVGGNTWAGGTGGSDTAGLGGRGGPYRLDAGHDIHQISDELKQQTPEHVKKAARKLAKEGLRNRLNEIKMNEPDYELYKELKDNIRVETQQLQSILEAAQMRTNERTWLRHQTEGEMDEQKLVEGLLGEHTVYKRRGISQEDSLFGDASPIRMKFVLDVSASMYRFRRIKQCMEVALMIMEALAPFPKKFTYDIVGHSGDSACIPLVNAGAPPANEKERLKVLLEMWAHSQYCYPGDHTIEGLELAVKTVVPSDEDENAIVILLSDANFNRYGITPDQLLKAMTLRRNVKVAALFIGWHPREAQRIVQELPREKAFVCHNHADVPHVFQKIFASFLQQ